MLTDEHKAAMAEGRRRAAERKKAQRAAADDVLTSPQFVDALPPDDKAPKERPAATSEPKSKGGRPAGYSPKSEELKRIRSGLVMMFTMAGMGVSMLDAYDGQCVALNAERLADSWAQVAEQNPRFRKVLAAMLEGGAIGNAVATSAMVFVPIAVHHGMAGPSLLEPAKTMGVTLPPDDALPTPHSDTRRGPTPVPPPAANDRSPRQEGVPVPPTGARPPDLQDVSYEDTAFPHTGPPERAA